MFPGGVSNIDSVLAVALRATRLRDRRCYRRRQRGRWRPGDQRVFGRRRAAAAAHQQTDTDEADRKKDFHGFPLSSSGDRFLDGPALPSAWKSQRRKSSGFRKGFFAFL